MEKVEITPNVYFVGCKDWQCRDFHGYGTPRGVTYNSYLLMDEKVCLVDLVKESFAGELLARISEIVEPEKIDYIVMNHVENDHASALPEIMKKAPNAKIFITAAGANEAKKLYGEYDYNIVKDGDEIKLGKYTLRFITLPMLHWPDSMVTYLVEEKVLFSNDAFGQHLCATNIFDDEENIPLAFEEAQTYYANILQPYNKLIAPALAKVGSIDIKCICTGHGIVWRSHIDEIIKKYAYWGNTNFKNKVLVVYDSMWGGTESMARAVLEGVSKAGVEGCLYRVGATEESAIASDILDAAGVLFGSPTHNYGMLKTMGALLIYLKGLKPAGKHAAVFGTYGWSGGAQKDMEDLLQKTGMLLQEAFVVRWSPDKEELAKCEEFGYEFAKRACNR